MKKFRFLFVLMASILLAFSSCRKEDEVKVEFRNPSYALKVGDTMKMADELKISNSDMKPEWTSSVGYVASIDADGNLTALEPGETSITAMVEGKDASCVVTVSEITAGKISIEAPESLEAEAWGSVKAAAETEGYDPDDFVWTFTATPDGLEFETEKVNSSEYKVRFRTFAADGKLTVKVADANSDVAQTAEVAVLEKVVPAAKITLTMPAELTEGEDVWGTVTAEVLPEDYDLGHLVWKFTPSSEDLGFRYEKISAGEYRVGFSAYAEGGNVLVEVSDELSETFNQGRIKVVEKPVEGVIDLKVSPVSLSLNVGDEPVALQVTYTPADYDVNLLVWTSSDESVATVAGGVITPVAEGEAVVKVTDKVSGKEASCTVAVATPVKEAVVKKIELDKTNISLRVGEESVQLIATCRDADGNVVENYAGLVWTADMMPGENGKEVEVVEVSQKGVVTPKNPGTTQVTVTDVENPLAKAICNVVVGAAEIKVETVKLLPASKTIEMGAEFTPEIVITPEDAENKTLVFSSSDESVAVVSDAGVVKGIAPGEAVITAMAVNGVKGECRVKVAEEYGIYLSETAVTLTVGQEKTLTATVTPEDAEDKTVTWSSSDPAVAEVKDGTVKAVKEGTAVITASANGKSATCEVTVETGIIDFAIEIVPSDDNLMTKGLMQDKTVELKAYYTKESDNTDYVPVEVSWTSSDNSIATVDSKGNVTAVIEHIDKSGIENGKKVVITHRADHMEKSIELTVVKALPEQVVMTAVPEVDGVPYRMMHGDSFTFEAKVLPEKADQSVWYAGGDYFQLPDNTFKATAVGYVEFTAYAADNTDARLKFTIEVLPVKLTDMTLSNTALDMVTGANASLIVNFTPSNASYKTIKWSSSDETVAVVDENGTVTAIGPGNAVITALQEENAMSCTCEVTVTDPVVEINVGDYYYSDGTTSTVLDESKTVIGIVFSTNNPLQQGDSGLASTYPECSHGYVVSTVEYTSACAVGREWNWADLGTWCSSNGYTLYSNEVNACGYTNTEGYIAANAAAIVTYDNVTIDFTLFNSSSPLNTHRAEVSVPENASAWYVPSYKEMQLLYENSETVNVSLNNVSGDPLHVKRIDYDDYMYQYWTSSYNLDANVVQAFNMTNGSWFGQKVESTVLPVRMILAF